MSFYVVLINAIYCILMPSLAFYFFCRYSQVKLMLGAAVGYVLLAWVPALFAQIYGVIGFFGEILLLAIWGKIMFSESWNRVLAVSVLIWSAVSVCGGIARWLVYLWADSIDGKTEALRYADMALGIFHLTMAGAVLLIIEKRLNFLDKNVLWTLAPLVFILLVELTIRDNIYGDTIVWDSNKGMIFPIIKHWEILILQFSAFLCMALSIFTYERMRKSLVTESAVEFLEQQAREQRLYIQSVEEKYESTTAFRHDIKNHLYVLEQLIARGENKAEPYLNDLKKIDGSLSYTVKTGNTAVDILIEGKLKQAREFGICVQTDIIIPREGNIKDIDWCVILANAIDNAISACQYTSDKHISIFGRKKGSLYLITVENSCDRSLSAPKEGTGLMNIRSAAEKYNGITEIKISGGIFRLDVLIDIW
ncbi:hypothetical protein IMSAG049_01010 [Clostridiales bacterium]|nr:hypothetical protein IMSAG049_01010 [Clostridiales bacterium]